MIQPRCGWFGFPVHSSVRGEIFVATSATPFLSPVGTDACARPPPRPPKAPKGWRTPKRFAPAGHHRDAPAFWSAVVLHRYSSAPSGPNACKVGFIAEKWAGGRQNPRFSGCPDLKPGFRPVFWVFPRFWAVRWRFLCRRPSGSGPEPCGSRVLPHCSREKQHGSFVLPHGSRPQPHCPPPEPHGSRE